jgi:predicted enzyme related to lactoylglutathione lyase
MHRSRLAGFIIDCATTDLKVSAAFWSQALGFPLQASISAEDTQYHQLETGPEGLHVEIQKVDHPPRVHLDIETDDIEAEVGRLEKLGAKRIKKIRTWWVMEAPTGHRFCVVRPQRADFAQSANQWR